MGEFLIQSRSKGFSIFLIILITAIFLFVSIISAFLLVAYGKAQWCVETRNFLSTIITGKESKIPADFTGTWRVKKDGILRKEIEVRQGVLHGKYVHWNDKGKKIDEGFYKNGKMEGKWILWYPNGNKWREWFCKAGKEHGKVTEWDFDGNLLSVTWKYENWFVLTLAGNDADIPSDFTGTWKIHREDGTVKEQMEVKDGVRHGRFVTWHEEGTRASEGFYKNGKLNGKLTLWYQDGRKRNETYFKDGLEHGKAIMWDFYGNLIRETWKYEGQPVSKEEFEKLTASEGKNKEGAGKSEK